MAPVVTAIQPPAVASKIKRPVPPGIQTNGASSIRSSPSPSMSTKKPPNSATTNGANPASARPANRPRREPSAQGGRISRNSAGMRSASLAADMMTGQAVEPPPYIRTDDYILKKYAGNPPSLVIHLHPTHFRFDQQDGIFPYKSPMRVFLEHMRLRTVPHDLLEYFSQSGVPFYEGCLIVQVHDHKSMVQSKEAARPTSASSKVVPSSIHNHNPYIVPSPYVPYPKESLGAQPEPAPAEQEDIKPKTAEEKDKESMPAPSLPGEGQKSKLLAKPKTFTMVLHPTPESLHADLLLRAATPRSAVDGRGGADANGAIPPSTPVTMVPPTPTAASMPPPAKKQKRERMELDGTNIHLAESQILLATNAPLFLEPTKSKEETIALLDALAHPNHSAAPPQPKTRKRTVAEMAADEAAAADQEKYMLILDERLSSAANGAQGGANGADKEGQGAVSTFEPRFERFKVIADIQREYKEKQEQEKAKAAENERKLAQEKQKQAQEQAAIMAQRQAESEKLRREQMMAQELKARQEQAREQQRRQQLAAQAAATQAQNAQNAANLAQSQATPTSMPNSTSGVVASGVPAQAQARFTQASQAPVSSPVVRQGTPHSMSSPMPGGVPMQQSNSNMANSPPRPPSAMQGHAPNVGGVPMSHSMSARASQQSHPAGTPRMPQGTPSMQATPVPRPAVAVTPRMGQASPPPNMMASNSQMGQPIMMGTPGSMPQQMHNSSMIAAQVAQQQRAIQQQQLQAAMQNGGMANIPMGNQMTPQQHQFLQQQLQQRLMLQQQQQQQQQHQQQQHQQQQQQQQHQQQQQQQQQQQRGHMGNMMTQQLAQRYAQQLNQMGGGQMSPQMQAQIQAQLQAQMANPMQRAQMAGQ
ncbi:hypothetical protein CPLU01_12259, partial [Colletotrichum plurivorum]